MTDLTIEDYNRALEFATRKHHGQYRKGGSEYITHPLAVCEIVKQKGYNLEYQITALFHDLLEDTDATYDEILNLSNESVVAAVKLLTKEKGYDMAKYIAGIKSNEMAFVVKDADRLHNLCSAAEADEKFRRKYIIETVEWYWDFSEEIRKATKDLASTLSSPLTNYPILYENKH